MDRKNWAVLFLLIVHVSGILGILSPYREVFLMLTPINLLISLGILLWFHQDRGPKFYAIMALVMVAGFIIEIIGVNTGWPFGSYEYGSPLGPKLFGTPFMIGVNWYILSYCGAILFRSATKSQALNAILAGLAITAFDVILEPVAIHLNFWTWSAESVPVQNYVTWAICISLFAYLFYKIEEAPRNPIATWVLGIQVLFFTGLLIGSQI